MIETMVTSPPESKQKQLSGAALLKALADSGTSEKKLRPVAELLRRQPNASGADAYAALEASGTTAPTLLKAAAMLAGTYEPPQPPLDAVPTFLARLTAAETPADALDALESIGVRGELRTKLLRLLGERKK